MVTASTTSSPTIHKLREEILQGEPRARHICRQPLLHHRQSLDEEPPDAIVDR
jgi:hypothetical protein